MKVAFCWFTHKGCEPFLAYSVAAARASIPRAAVFFFDDAHNPSNGRALRALHPQDISPTTWPRRYNLNGWPAIDGILDSMKGAAGASEADFVVKNDWDTMSLDAAWLDESAEMSGFQFWKADHLMGCLYGMRAGAVDRVAGHLRSGERKGGPPEDKTISDAARRIFPGRVRVWEPDRKHLRWFCRASNDPAKMDCMAAVFHWRAQHSTRDLENMAAVSLARRFDSAGAMDKLP